MGDANIPRHMAPNGNNRTSESAEPFPVIDWGDVPLVPEETPAERARRIMFSKSAAQPQPRQSASYPAAPPPVARPSATARPAPRPAQAPQRVERAPYPGSAASRQPAARPDSVSTYPNRPARPAAPPARPAAPPARPAAPPARQTRPSVWDEEEPGTPRTRKSPPRRPSPPSKPSAPRRNKPLFLVILADIALAGVILCVFSLFHHVIPMLRSQNEPVQPTAVYVAPSPTPAPTPVPTAMPEVITEATPEPTPDLRTPWQIKFADKFTPEIVATENSYTSPNISIQIDKIVIDEGSKNQVTYFLADVYVASLDCFKTYVANNELKYLSTQEAVEMDAAVNALLSVSGDFITYQAKGFLMRNGQLYMDDYTRCDLCVLYADGTLATYGRNGYVIEEVLAQNPVQIWNFGPALLDENGKACTSFNVNSTVAQTNPRCAIGFYEPGHYCFVIVDGRQPGYSVGMKLPALSTLFETLGCQSAYNLDGGGSATILFNDAVINHPSNGDRKLGDILYVAEPVSVQSAPAEGTQTAPEEGAQTASAQENTDTAAQGGEVNP